MFRAAYRRILGSVLITGLSILSAHALDVGPKAIPLKIFGVQVEPVATATLQVRKDADTVTLDISVVGDLASIQEKALDIARRLPFPKDGCAHKGANMVINSIDAAHITPSGSTAVIEMSGHVTAWACAKILGATVKTKVAADNVTIDIPVELYLVTPQEIGVRLKGSAEVKTGNPLTSDAARAIADEINARLTTAIAKALDASSARASLPPLPGIEATIEGANFAQDGAKLLVQAHGHAKLTGATFASLLGFFAKANSP